MLKFIKDLVINRTRFKLYNSKSNNMALKQLMIIYYNR